MRNRLPTTLPASVLAVATLATASVIGNVHRDIEIRQDVETMDKFWQSCDRWGVHAPYWPLLQGNCRKENGEWRYSWLNLRACLVNIGGRLYPMEKYSI